MKNRITTASPLNQKAPLRANQHLVDTVVVHVHDIESEAGRCEAFACDRYAAQLRYHHARERVIGVMLFDRRSSCSFEELIQAMNGETAVDEPGAVLPLHHVLLTLLAHCRDIADERLHHIVQRDEPLHIPEFVNHRCSSLAMFLEQLYESHDAYAVRHKERVHHMFAKETPHETDYSLALILRL